MYLQGDLQSMFDALYHLGIIDPVLDMDWNEALTEMPYHYDDFSKAVGIVNNFQGDTDLLMIQLEQFDEKTLSFLAMEVAKEFADYHSREDLH